MTAAIPFASSRAVFHARLEEALSYGRLATLVVTVTDDPQQHFVQFALWPDGTVQWEVSTYRDAGLFRKHKLILTPEQRAALDAHGFRYGADSPNYQRTLHIGPDHAIAAIVAGSCQLLADVYGCDPNALLQFEVLVP